MAAYCWKRNTETDRLAKNLVVHLSLCHADIFFVGNPSENAHRHHDALPSMCMSSVNLLVFVGDSPTNHLKIVNDSGPQTVPQPTNKLTNNVFNVWPLFINS